MTAASSQPNGELSRAWPVLLACAAGIGLGLSPLPFYTIGVFAPQLEQEFGWSRSAILLGPLFLTISTICCAPIAGWLADRFGARPLALFSTFALGVIMASFALIGPDIRIFYALMLTMSALSQGTLPMTFARVINGWFDAKRGLALGIAFCTTGITGALAPRYVQALIDDFGWRWAYVGLGLLPLLIALPLLILLLREAPPRTLDKDPTTAETEGMTLAAAFGSVRYWIMAVAIALVSVGVGGAIANMVPLLTDRGYSPGEAASIFGIVGLSVIFGRLAAGFLMDRIWAPLVGALFLALPAISCLVLANDSTTTQLVLVAVALVGLAAGAEFDLIAYLVARYFGRLNFSTLYAFQYAAFALGSGAGPAIFGAVHDRTQSYQPILFVAAGLFVTGAAMLLLLGKYPRPLTPEAAPETATARA